MKEFLSANSTFIEDVLKSIVIIFLYIVTLFCALPREEYERKGKKKTRLKSTARFDVFMLIICIFSCSLGVYQGLYVGTRMHEFIPDTYPFWLTVLDSLVVHIPFFIIIIMLSYSPLKNLFIFIFPLLKKMKRGGLFDDTENTDIPDIPDSDTSGGVPDRPIHHDRHCP